MQKVETSWRRDGDWKSRYSKLYSSRRISQIKAFEESSCTDLYPTTRPPEEEPRRISFMSCESSPYSSILIRARSARRDSTGSECTPELFTSILSQRSDMYGSRGLASMQSENLGGHDTMLLDMVRAQSKELKEEAQDKTLHLPRDDVSEDQSSEACVHGLSVRAGTERSVSRSRFSRMSTRRDMDIPSILAFTTTLTAPDKTHLEIPAFQKVNTPLQEETLRWSIRRSVCPVCSQKWRDRTSVTNVKSSGLKRNSSSEMPSVIAPARLRASIAMAYIPRPTLAVVNENVAGISVMRNPSSTWQLTRARRFRAPKAQLPPPEATAPPSAAAPMARKDLDIRVGRFLADNEK